MATRTYRTRNRAENVVEMPKKLAIITNAKFKNAISLYVNDKVHLLAIKEENLDMKDNNVFFNGLPLSTTKVMELATIDYIDELDLSLLRALYSCILENSEKSLKKGKLPPQIINIYIPELMKYFGKKTFSRNERLSIINNIMRFHSLVGVINGDILPVMLYMGEKRLENTIAFSSPYFTRVLEEIYKDSILLDKKGKPLTNNAGVPKTKASHSYLIKPSIRNERNKKAIEIVCIVVSLIERSGNYTPHIKAKTIVEQNPLLSYSMEGQTSSHKNLMLHRAFKKAWELLRTHTDLEKVYSNIQLPDPTDSSSIPTVSTLDKVYEFRHDGKVKCTE